MNYNYYALIIETLRKNNDLAINDLLKSETGQICSKKTYSKIRKSIVIRDNVIYSELISRFKLSCMNVQLDLDYSLLWKAIEYCRINQIIDEADILLNILNPYQNDYYCHFIYQIILHIRKYYRDAEKPSGNELSLILNLLPIFEQEIYTIAIMLLVIFCYMLSEEECKKLYDCVEQLNHPVLEIYRLNYYLNKEMYYDAIRLMDKIEVTLNQDNIIRRFDFFDTASVLLEDLNATTNIYKDKMKDWLQLKESQLPENKLIQGYGNLANEGILQNDLVQTVQYLEKIRGFESRRKKAIYVYLIYCKQALGLKVEDELYRLAANDCYTQSDNALYAYYLDKGKRTSKENKKYLYEIVKNDISKYEKVYIKIVEEELYRLSLNTKRFNDYAKLKHIVST